MSHAAVLEHQDRWPDLRSPLTCISRGATSTGDGFILPYSNRRVPGESPYREVLTHGFVVDGEGKKMSKSQGNVIDPQEMVDLHGAEILRLWVAAEDYTVDIRISDEIVKRLIDAYRRIRNTSRYILGNLYDFDPESDRLPYGDMGEMDRAALNRLQLVIRRVRKAYENYQFHVVYYTLYNYCTVDLSALYLDVLKDRLYTSRPKSRERRSAQTAMFIILDTLMRLIAPILTFTAEEVWAALPAEPGRPQSVHMTLFPEAREDWIDRAVGEKWKTLAEVKGRFQRPLKKRGKTRWWVTPWTAVWKSPRRKNWPASWRKTWTIFGPWRSSPRWSWSKATA